MSQDLVLLRNFRLSDIDRIDEIFRRQPAYGVPSLNNVITNSTIVNREGKIIGYGVVKSYAEAVLLIDGRARKREKVEALIKGINQSITACKLAGIEQLFLFSNDEKFTRSLQKRFGFKKASGATLFLELDDLACKES